MMQKTPLTLTLMASLLFAVSACQPAPDKSTTDTTSTTAQTTKPPINQPLAEAKTPKELTNALVTLSEEKLKNRLICTKLDDAIQALDNKSKIEDIHAIQRQLTACLPAADNAQTLQWLTDYQALYGRFLMSNDDMHDENLYAVIDTLEQGKKLTVEQLKSLSPRNRYLIGLVQGRADVNLLYVGEGMYIFHHDLQAMADLFIPYLPKDQQTFIQRMAKDNQDIFWNDAAVAIPFEEVIERASFWEDYIQRYPNSYFIKDAKQLFNMYRHAVFFGSDNSQWTNDAVTEFIGPEYQQAIEKLAKNSDSMLAKDARALLEFMAMPNSKRNQAYPVPKVDDEGYEISDWARPRYQLNQVLPIPSPWENDNYRDCLSSIVCVDYDY